MKLFLWTGGVVAALTIAGCGPEPLGVADPPQADGSTRLQAASAPATVPFIFVFDDLNPCSGEIHTVTISGTERIHEHNGQLVIHGERTITTSSGFVGRGTHSFVANGNIEKLTLTDILRHPPGAQIRAHLTFVFDVSGSTVRVEKGAITCVRR
jgi:hypothetical protein